MFFFSKILTCQKEINSSNIDHSKDTDETTQVSIYIKNAITCSRVKKSGDAKKNMHLVWVHKMVILM